MNEDQQLTPEELEEQEGKQLPRREVMSIASSNPGSGAIVPIPEDPVIVPIDDPEPI
jgi:hypothetical protein